MLSIRYLQFFLLIGYICFPANYINHNVIFAYFFIGGVFFLPGRIKLQYLLYVLPLVGIVFIGFISLLIDLRSIVWRDLLETFRFLLIILFFIVGARLNPAESFFIQFRFSIFFFAGVACLELFLFSYFFDLRSFYVRTDSLYFYKPINFWFSTYFAGFMYLFFSLICLEHFAKRGAVGIFLLTLIFIGLTVATQSRTMFLLAVPMFCILLSFAALKFPLKLFLFLFLSVSFCVYFLSLDKIIETFAYLSYGLEHYLFNFSNSLSSQNSLSARYGQMLFAFNNNPLLFIGAGIGKGYNEYLESFFALYLFRYGFLGILLYCLFWFVFPLLVVRGSLGYFFHFLFVVLIMVGSLSSVMTDQFFIAPMLSLFLGHKISPVVFKSSKFLRKGVILGSTSVC